MGMGGLSFMIARDERDERDERGKRDTREKRETKTRCNISHASGVSRPPRAFQLTLEKHCIETALKRLHNRLMSEYFKAKGESPEVEKKIELIGQVLTDLDFSHLRTRFPALAGHSDKDVTLIIDADSHPHIYITGEEISF
jgi:hypothetical protein